MQEIASRMKVDASRVSQLHAAALVQLKAKVHSCYTEAKLKLLKPEVFR